MLNLHHRGGLRAGKRKNVGGYRSYFVLVIIFLIFNPMKSSHLLLMFLNQMLSIYLSIESHMKDFRSLSIQLFKNEQLIQRNRGSFAINVGKHVSKVLVKDFGFSKGSILHGKDTLEIHYH